MKLYTWKDVERKLLLNNEEWKNITDIEVYSSRLVVITKSRDNLSQVRNIISDILGPSYKLDDEKVYLEFGNGNMSVEYEVDENLNMFTSLYPLFNNVLYQNNAYNSDKLRLALPGCPVIAFHSYKGGVGRTLSLLAFVKAWSSENEIKKLLIVDSDIEAPGITWLNSNVEENEFSYLDLLEIIQGNNNVDFVIDNIVEKMKSMTITINTKLMKVDHFILPTYRYVEQMLDMYSSPESIVKSYDKKYIIAEVLSRLGERLGVGAVVVDLRAGISEFSAPILFDSRVKKYVVTSTSYQSIKGTILLLEQLNKGLQMDENAILPEILLTMIPDGLNTTDILSELVSAYDAGDTDNSILDNIVTELPFASELIHLESLDQIMRNLEEREFYQRIRVLIHNYYTPVETVVENNNQLTRDDAINRIHELAKKQITAEGNSNFNILMTESIKYLVNKYEKSIPTTVIMGAKGSGKTFLFREMLRKKYWEEFVKNFNDSKQVNDVFKEKTVIVPMLATRNASEFKDLIDNAVDIFNSKIPFSNMNKYFWINNSEEIEKYKKDIHDTLDWKVFWKSLFQKAFKDIDTLDKVDEALKNEGVRVVFLIDGLEEILTGTLSTKTEKNAIVALVQDLVNEFKIKYSNIGFIVFLRKDLARDAIEVNYEQFYTLFKSVELSWSRTEALRLVLWLVKQAIPEFYKEKVGIEIASSDVIENSLVKLWGTKLGTAHSNEAYSSRWILAALSDFNGQLQARDIIRFLQYATEDIGKKVYDDRFIMPAEIRKAVPKCSEKKIDEIKQEIAVLKPIFEKLEGLPTDKKILPFIKGTFDLNAVEEKLMKQEGFLKEDNEKYYLPEIIRHALKFKYEKGARPRVLSLIFEKS